MTDVTIATSDKRLTADVTLSRYDPDVVARIRLIDSRSRGSGLAHTIRRHYVEPLAMNLTESGCNVTVQQPEQPMSDLLTAAEVLKMGAPYLSYRQLDYWCRCYLISTVGGGGSGRPRLWPIEEAQAAVAIAHLVQAGLTLQAAHKVARGEGLAAGVRVLFEEAS